MPQNDFRCSKDKPGKLRPGYRKSNAKGHVQPKSYACHIFFLTFLSYIRKIQFIASCVKAGQSFSRAIKIKTRYIHCVVHYSSDDLGSDVVLRADK
ncbi:hypothetical protein ACVBKF_01315 [Shewanella sp. 0m-11]